MKSLVAFFSASGNTKEVAENLSTAIGGDLFEIEPVEPYTRADLNWTDSNSRSTIECKNPASRPAIIKLVENPSQYDVIFLGFPIWWYTAPRIINTFLEENDFAGKKIVLFATSGGSGLGNTAEDLRASASNAEIISGKIFNHYDADTLKNWAEQYL